MNWYKISKIKIESSLMGTISRMLLVGVAHVAIIAFLIKNYNMTPEKAEEIVSLVDSKQTENVLEKPQVVQPVQKAPLIQQEAPQTTQESARAMIKRYEGFSSKSYQDTPENRSIGYGYNLSNPRAKSQIESLGLDYNAILSGRQKITKEQADILFQESFSDAVKQAQSFAPNYSSLPSSIRNVLIDMSYNLGPRINSFKQMRNAVENQDWDAMAKAMVNSDWYGQVGNRSKELVNIVLSQ